MGCVSGRTLRLVSLGWDCRIMGLYLIGLLVDLRLRVGVCRVWELVAWVISLLMSLILSRSLIACIRRLRLTLDSVLTVCSLLLLRVRFCILIVSI